MSTITDISFPDIFESLNTGRESSDRVLQTVIEGLLEGRYKPGERVVARQLAEELGVSIVPVREAIHILAGEGVIDLTARKGARIRSMDREEVGAWWRIQATIGQLGVGFAARRIGHHEENVAKLNDAMDLIRENAGQLDGFEFLMVLLRYHMVVHDVAEMPQLNEATRRLGFFFWAIFFPQYIPVREYGEMYVRNHQRVTDAVVSGDPASAQTAYQYHIDWTDALIAGERPDVTKPWVKSP
ncbi:MAG: GntR family transcriptional regulator [Gammaproteobacteria bacterium]|nr:GntR family transcriptional regulator [Gammaproteobacteria bacterium]